MIELELMSRLISSDVELTNDALSNFLAIIGAKANVVPVNRDTVLPAHDVIGFLGFRTKSKVQLQLLKKSDKKFLPLAAIRNHAVAIALLNMVYPRHLMENTKYDAELFLEENIDVILGSIFASVNLKGDENLQKHSMEDHQTFLAIMCDNASKHFSILHESDCYDFFCVQDVSDNGNDENVLAYARNWSNEESQSSGHCVFAVIVDNKLVINERVQELITDHDTKFGNYKSDELLTQEDWNEMTLLNSTISSAESFVLCVEGQEEDLTKNADNDEIIPNQRYISFENIKKEMENLQNEIQRFPSSRIPSAEAIECRENFVRREKQILNRIVARKRTKLRNNKPKVLKKFRKTKTFEKL